MPSRRSHTKSRHGCARCKLKRIKCDEVRPVCGACLKHGAQCQFGDLTGEKKMSLSHIMSSQPSSSASVSMSTPSSTSAPSPMPMQTEMFHTPITLPSLKSPEPEYSMNVRDLELLANFLTVVVPTLADIAEIHEVWRGPVIKEAVRHPFLMHGFLSLSALHMALTSNAPPGDPIYQEMSLRQDRAMALYRQQLNNITEDNCHAIFLFSSIVSINAFSYPQLPGPKKTFEDTMNDLIDILVFIKGITVILGFTNEWVKNGPIAPLLRADVVNGRIDEEGINLLNTSCQSLKDRNAQTTDDPVVKATNDTAIEAIRIAYSIQWDTTAAPFIWPNFIGEDFHDLLRRRQPMSLVILAHYGIMMHVCNERWWAKDWGRKAIWSVSKLIDKEWLPAIAYPMKELNVKPPNEMPDEYEPLQGPTASSEHTSTMPSSQTQQSQSLNNHTKICHALIDSLHKST